MLSGDTRSTWTPSGKFKLLSGNVTCCAPSRKPRKSKAPGDASRKCLEHPHAALAEETAATLAMRFFDNSGAIVDGGDLPKNRLNDLSAHFAAERHSTSDRFLNRIPADQNGIPRLRVLFPSRVCNNCSSAP